jgi:tRNA G18 (ribose-2'-O)-methylase SpoU
LIPIDDPADPRIADYVGMRDGRTGRDVVIVEGAVALEQLVGSRYPVRSVLVLPTQVDRVPAGIDAPVYVAPHDVLTATVGFDLHRGVVASADRMPLPTAAAVCGDARTVLVLEDLNDHENLGSLFRNAAAFGVDAVLLTPRCADPLYRRSVRVSLGHALRVPFARVDSIGDVRALGFTVLALTPDPAATKLNGIQFSDRVAFALGAEGAGLSAAATAAADQCVRIPMAPGVDSLNVATAAAVALYALRSAVR